MIDNLLLLHDAEGTLAAVRPNWAEELMSCPRWLPGLTINNIILHARHKVASIDLFKRQPNLFARLQQDFKQHDDNVNLSLAYLSGVKEPHTCLRLLQLIWPSLKEINVVGAFIDFEKRNTFEQVEKKGVLVMMQHVSDTYAKAADDLQNGRENQWISYSDASETSSESESDSGS